MMVTVVVAVSTLTGLLAVTTAVYRAIDEQYSAGDYQGLKSHASANPHPPFDKRQAACYNLICYLTN